MRGSTARRWSLLWDLFVVFVTWGEATLFWLGSKILCVRAYLHSAACPNCHPYRSDGTNTTGKQILISSWWLNLWPSVMLMEKWANRRDDSWVCINMTAKYMRIQVYFTENCLWMDNHHLYPTNFHSNLPCWVPIWFIGLMMGSSFLMYRLKCIPVGLGVRAQHNWVLCMLDWLGLLISNKTKYCTKSLVLAWSRELWEVDECLGE